MMNTCDVDNINLNILKKPLIENESIGKREMGINYKGSQGQTERAVVL
jgi:hypothetical protein